MGVILTVAAVAVPTLYLLATFGLDEPTALTGEAGVAQLLALIGAMVLSFVTGLVATRLSTGDSRPTLLKVLDSLAADSERFRASNHR